MFKTETGSTYEIDDFDGVPHVRRLSGKALPTVRVGRNDDLDGWALLKDRPVVQFNCPVLLVWPSDVPLLDGTMPNVDSPGWPMTVTSRVVSIDGLTWAGQTT